MEMACLPRLGQTPQSQYLLMTVEGIQDRDRRRHLKYHEYQRAAESSSGSSSSSSGWHDLNDLFPP